MFLEVFGHTDKGKKRANNEDSYICYSSKNSRIPHYLLAVADGMGGHQGGEIASAIAVETIKEDTRSKLSQEEISQSEYPQILERSIQFLGIIIAHGAYLRMGASQAAACGRVTATEACKARHQKSRPSRGGRDTSLPTRRPGDRKHARPAARCRQPISP